MADEDDSCVLVGTRKNLPKLSVDAQHTPAILRYRNSTASTPDGESRYTIETSPVTPFNTPTKFSSLQAYKSKFGPSPTLKDLQEGRVHLLSKDEREGKDGTDCLDSGYSGWQETTRKKLSFDNNSTEGVRKNDSQGDLWRSFTSPVQDLQKKLKGRPSFFEETEVVSKLNIQPQQILAGIILMILVSSFCFALFIGVNHLSETGYNGKIKSILFGSERRYQMLKDEGRVLERDIVDESGAKLGGKRASIQYAYETVEVDSHLDLFELSASIEKTFQFLQAQDALDTLNQLDIDEEIIIEEFASVTLDKLSEDDFKSSESVEAKPAKNKPEHPKSVDSKHGPEDPKPKPAYSKSRPQDSKPGPTDSKPGPEDSKPKSTDSKPGHHDSKPGPTDSKPGPQDPKPKPAYSKSKPQDSKPGPADSKPKSADSKPGPHDSKSELADSKPGLEDSKPKTKDSKPGPHDSKPGPADSKPKPADSKPKPADLKPEAVVSKIKTEHAVHAEESIETNEINRDSSRMIKDEAEESKRVRRGKDGNFDEEKFRFEQ